MNGARTLGLVGVLTLAACGGDADPAVAPLPAASERVAAPERVHVTPGVPRHAEDGGWAPSEELLRRAAGMADPDIAAELEELAPAERVLVLRAGLRLPDGPAAVACASRLEWGNVDGWESARLVELLTPEIVLCESETMVFHRLREILGSEDTPAFLEALPPLPWKHDPEVLAHFHRMDRDVYLPRVAAVAARSDEAVSDALNSNLSVASGYTDRGREALAAFWLRLVPMHPDDVEPPADGLPRELRRWLRADVLDVPMDEMFQNLDPYVGRWLRDCPPRQGGDADDRRFRLAVTRRARADSWGWTTTLLVLQLGLLRDADSGAYLRQLVETEEDEAGLLALARRGDAEALSTAIEWAFDRKDEDRAALATALLWEVRPAALLGPMRDAVADQDGEDVFVFAMRLQVVREMAEWYGLANPPDALTSLEPVAFASGDPVLQAVVGACIPGCGTRRLAVASARGIAGAEPEDARWMLRRIDAMSEGLALGFLEIGAGDALLPAIRRAALAEPYDGFADVLSFWLLQLEDPAFPASLLPRVLDIDVWHEYATDGRRSPVLAAHYAGLLSGTSGDVQHELAQRLARAQGLPPAAAWIVAMGEGALPEPVLAHLLADQPVDAVVAVLAAHPDEVPEDVGLIHDERIAAHLRSVRDRRELDLYWNATAELSLMGDPEARAEYEAALRTGRYRVVDQGTLLQRTYGMDLATIPFLIDELRSNCCRVVTNSEGDLIEELFGIDGFGLATMGRVTPYDRATRIWNEAGGRFAWSRLAGRLVPVPR